MTEKFCAAVDLNGFREVKLDGSAEGLEPDHAPLPAREFLDLPTIDLETIPAFRFAYDLDASPALMVDPTGFRGVDFDRLPADRPWVIGQIFCSTPMDAFAVFSTGEPADRTKAKRALRNWAKWDGWRLTFSEGLNPLVRLPDRREMLVMGATCVSCGNGYGTGLPTHMLFQREGRIDSRCSRCGARRSWLRETELGAAVYRSGAAQ
jgi:hypothetical protein